MFKTIRVTVLVTILVLVAGVSWQTTRRIAQWDLPLRAAVYPIAGDTSDVTRRYIASLSSQTFQPIERFIGEEAERYDVKTSFGQHLRMKLAPEIKSLPPPPPIDGNVAAIMWWSLQLRYWAWSVAAPTSPASDVSLFVIYFDPKKTDTLEHSLGLEKGRIGVVKAFASEALAGSNNMVIAHELLHTVGATDKYDARTGQPRFPDGYAKPDADPRYPQRFAEIMAGRIPLSAAESTIPPSLNATLIGEATAREINWLR
jgi:hypothetical protein